MIEVRKSFATIIFIAIALGFAKEFMLFFTAVTIHELSHIAVAKCFKVKFIKIIFTPIGEIAVIRGIENLCLVKRCCIYLAGPFVNLLLWLLTKSVYPLFAQVNLYLCLFNLLPAYPLDGGCLLQTAVGSFIGMLNACAFLKKISKALSCFMIVSGIIQVVLYPYNITLLCIGFYLLKSVDKEYLDTAYELYKILLKGYGRIAEKGSLRSKTVHVSSELSLLKFVRMLSLDHFFIIHITDGNNIIKTIDEADIARHITEKGITGTFGDICKDTEKMVTNLLNSDRISTK